MTEKQLTKVFAGWQRDLGLAHWSLKLEFHTPAPEGKDATVWSADDYCDARIRFAADWKKWDNWFANYIAVHELLHCVFREIDWAHAQARQYAEQPQRSVLRHTFKHALECTIDQLAVLLLRERGVE